MRRHTASLLLAAVLGLATSCNEVSPIEPCKTDKDCPVGLACVIGAGQCVPRDFCGAGIYNAKQSPPVLLPGEDPRLPQVGAIVVQVAGRSENGAMVSEGVAIEGDGILVLTSAGLDQNREKRFEADFHVPRTATSGPEGEGEQDAAPTGNVFVEATVAVDGSGDCQALIYLWPDNQRRVEACVGSDAISFEGTSVEDVDTSEPHAYRIEFKQVPEVGEDGIETGNLKSVVALVIDGTERQQVDYSAVAKPKPEDKPLRSPIAGFGMREQGLSRWDWVRWGCVTGGGPCVPGIQEDDTDCQTIRQGVNSLRCNEPGRAPRPERCDDDDNDCDGEVDENWTSIFERTPKGDGVGVPGSLLTEDENGNNVRLFLDDEVNCIVGTCNDGRVVCDPTTRSTLTCAVANSQGRDAELCDGVDNDCDGQTDEDFKPRTPGLPNSGSSLLRDEALGLDGLGLREACSVGECKVGVVECDPDDNTRLYCNRLMAGPNGTLIAPPAVDECGNGKDDNCNNQIDEGYDKDGDRYQECERCLPVFDDAGELQPVAEGCIAYADCNDDADAGGRTANIEQSELCDNIDNDCDGKFDEEFDEDGDLFTECGGTCRDAEGKEKIDADTGDPEVCAPDCNDRNPNINPDAAEICDGFDNNCKDGIDELFGIARAGNPNERIYNQAENCGACSTAASVTNCFELSTTLHTQPICQLVDVANAVYACSTTCVDGFKDASGLFAGCECELKRINNPETGVRDGEDCDDGQPGCTELCNGEDDDCNGTVDDAAGLRLPTCYTGNPAELNHNQTACRQGHWACLQGELRDSGAENCIGQVLPAPTESCNGIDDDCDGTIDEFVPEVGDPCQDVNKFGICRTGSKACQRIGPNQFDIVCQTPSPQNETCNQLDDNCDGKVDEPFRNNEGNGIYTTQVEHCGACGNSCRFLDAMNAIPNCNLGRCVVAGCTNGFNDNNQEVADGCEAQQCTPATQGFALIGQPCFKEISDPAHCRCSGTYQCVQRPNGVAVECVSNTADEGEVLTLEQCGDKIDPRLSGTAETCNNVDDNCDGRVDETNECDFDNAESACVTGQCRIAECFEGFDNCNVRLDDGCEQELNTVTHCGQCNRPCNVAVADSCGDGQCRCGIGPACDVDVDPNTRRCDRQAAPATCVECLESNDCAGVQGRTKCVGKVCRQCDPSDPSTCNAFPNTPICRAPGNCQQCASDAECTVLFGVERGICVEGRCERCDRLDNSGCGGGTPICRMVQNVPTCTPCANNNDCAGRGECRDGECTGCNPLDHTGCLPSQVCCNLTCVDTGVDPGEKCQSCNAACDLTVANQCTARACMCGNLPACSGRTPFCLPDAQAPGGARCVPCRDAGDCLAGAPFCIQNECRACDPSNNGGCGNDARRPICDAGDKTCRGCSGDAECAARNAQLGQCTVDGSCQQCDPRDNTGCAVGQICNAQFQCVACQGAADCAGHPNGPVCEGGLCVRCQTHNDCDGNPAGEVCNAQSGRCERCDDPGDCSGHPDGDICIDGFCRPCGVDAQCSRHAEFAHLRGPVCARGTCEECDLANNRGCAAGTPICASPLGVPDCVPCGANNPCPGGTFCVGGQCRGCTPGTDLGCESASAIPVCDLNTFTCRPCAVDAECSNKPGRGQCVEGRCQGCDYTANGANFGCDPAGATPVCNRVAGEGVCGGCSLDSQCANNANGTQCIAGGRCRVCDPADNAGCDPAGARPLCRANANGTTECVACAGDPDCANNPNGALCVAGKCEACNPGNQSGCGGNQLCCRNGANTPAACEATGAGTQCASCDAPCGGRSADTCTNRGCRCGANPACGGIIPICNGGACVQCVADGDCAGNPNGNTCVNNTCQPCDVASHRGCGAEQLCCPGGGGVPACINTGGGANDSCTACGVACNIDSSDRCSGRTCKCGAGNLACGGLTPFCKDADGRCVGCLSDQTCPGGLQCVTDVCRRCDPADNGGCLQASNTPICNAATFECRGCANSNECIGNPAGNVCLPNGSCGRCDDGLDCEGAPPGNVCDSTTRLCRTCTGQADCANHPAGNACIAGECDQCLADGDCGAGKICVSGVCQACDAANNRGCPQGALCAGAPLACHLCNAQNPNDDLGCAGATSQCVAGACRLCDPANDAGCGGATPQCVIGGNGLPVCATCDSSNDAGCMGATPQCVAGACQACDPANDNGCGAGQQCFLNAGVPTCGACDPVGDVGCVAPNAQCVAGTCRACDPANDNGCAAPNGQCVSVAGVPACFACDSNGDAGCGGATPECVSGICRACDPTNDNGCGVGQQCFLNAGVPVCGACDPTNDNGCAAPNAQCVLNAGVATCVACDPTGDTGCGGATPQCVNNVCRVCDPTNDNGCGVGQQCFLDGGVPACGACDPDGDVGCNGGTPECVAGTCRACDPTDDEGCNGGTPECFLNAGVPACGACDPDGDVGCNGGTPECVTGVCEACDPSDQEGCDANDPVCAVVMGDLTCRGCTDDAECANNPHAAGNVCAVSGSCETCTIDDDCDGNPAGEDCKGNGLCGPL